MNSLFYKGRSIKKIGFFGLGKSSRGMLEFFEKRYENLSFVLRSDNKIALSDIRESSHFDEIYAGRCALDNISEDILFLSPSVRRERLNEVSNKVILSSDAEFFLENTDSDVYAVTGSDGKSTVTTLSALLLTACGKAAHPIGNIGVPMTPFLEKGKEAIAVCELSSFQLMYFAPRIKRALITNISENHLDWHTSFSEYVSAKENILKNAEEPILNADCELSLTFIDKYTPFALYSASKNYADLKKTSKSEHYIYLEGGHIVKDGERMLDISRIRAIGRHNVENFMAAIAMCADVQASEYVTRVAEEFSGLSHRCQFFKKIGGTSYVNSSIDSTPKRTATTLSSIDGRHVVILGGKGKGLDYTPILAPIKEKARAVILTGANAEEILEVIKNDPDFEKSRVRVILKSDFDDAVKEAVSIAESGDTVILSPASTSYDRFSNFEERGDYFMKTVDRIYQTK